MQRFRFATNTLRDLFVILLATFFITLAVWLPHILKIENLNGLNFKEGMNTIYRNFDGVEYIVIAKSFYFPDKIAQLPQYLSANYYAAHFPLYSIFILVLAPLLGFLKSMLIVSLIFTTLSTIAFYFFVKDFKLSKQPLFLTLLFLILPARWLIVHSVGSAEPIFIFFVICSIYFFTKYELEKKWLFIYLAAIFGLLSQLTRPPGILLFISFGVYILWRIIKNREQSILKSIFRAKISYYPLLLIPFGLLAIFYWFSISYQDFFAYFHSGDNIHLTLPPFQVFNKDQFWVGEIWLEDIVYILILGFLGGITLFKKGLYPAAFFVLTYMVATSFVAHRDISRYALPIFPFVLIAFEKLLISKEFKIVLVIVILAIYFYSQNFLLANVSPIPNLSVFD